MHSREPRDACQAACRQAETNQPDTPYEDPLDVAAAGLRLGPGRRVATPGARRAVGSRSHRDETAV